MNGILRHFVVREDGEWGEFFVHERPPVRSRDSTQYAATFTCYSSFGVYGHHWFDMGSPFVEFIADISADYLISKIGGERRPSSQLICSGIRKQILDRRYAGLIDRDNARDAWDFVSECEGEYSDDEIGGAIYRGLSIEIDFEFTTTEYSPASKQFVKKLWPLFVSQLRAVATAPEDVSSM